MMPEVTPLPTMGSDDMLITPRVTFIGATEHVLLWEQT